MDDVGFGDSEEENLEVEEQKEKATLTMDKSVTKNSSSLGLPMNEASEAWMDDVGDGVSFDDSEGEILEVEIPEKKTADTNDKVIIESEKNLSISLPMNELSNAWGDDLGDAEAFDDLETDVVGNAAGFYTSKEPKEKPPKDTAMAKLSQSVIEKNLSLDSFWLNKLQIDEAEKNYYEMKAKLKIDPIKIHKQDDPDNDDSDSSGKKNKENP